MNQPKRLDPNLWEEAQRLYHAALDRPAASRAAFLQQACPDNPALLREVESLLAFDDAPPDFLDAAALPAVALPEGSTVGPYRIEACIGRGGMGLVYRAEQQAPVRRTVALKMIKPGMDSAHVIARFQAERQALALMDHPNIARVFDAGATPAGRLYFAMELVDGRPLTEYCRDLPLADRLALFLPVCHAIQHAHQKGILHRDIKPSNLLVGLYDGRPVPKVIDFGIAKAMQQPLTSDTMYTRAGTVVGTLDYMSPEQAGTSGADVDTRSDVYSLGAVLYELLTGITPLERGTDLELLHRIREVTPPPPSSRIQDPRLRRQVRGDLDWITAKALEKDPTRRYASVSELAQDIASHLAGAPVAAGPPSAIYRLGKLVRRHRGAVVTAAVLAVVLVAAAAVSTREAIRARRAQQEADAVVAFLQNDLLAQASASVQASSSGHPDPDLKVRTALDRAAAGIGARFREHPLVEASVRHTIGATYLDLGLFQEARRQLELAAALRTAALGDEAPETLESENLLVHAWLGLGEPARAEPLGQRVLTIRQRRLGPLDPATLVSLDTLAAIERAFGRDAEAANLYRRVAAERAQVLGPEHPDTLRSLSRLGYVSMLLEQYAQAVETHRAVLQIRRRLLGEDHPETIQSRYALALAMINNGQADRAMDELNAVFAWRRRVLGAAHVDTINALNALGLASQARGRYSESEAYFHQCLDVARPALGPDHPTTHSCLNNLAEDFEFEGKYAQAVRAFQQEFDSNRRLAGPDSPDTLRAMSNLAATLGLAGRAAEARTLFEQVIAMRRQVLGATNPKTLSSMDGLATLELRQRRFALAEPLFRQVVALRRTVLGATHPRTLASVTSWAECLLELGRCQEAEPLLREALQGSGKDEWVRGQRESLLGWSLRGEGRRAEAEALLQSGYERMRREENRRPAVDRAETVPARHRLP